MDKMEVTRYKDLYSIDVLSPSGSSARQILIVTPERDINLAISAYPPSRTDSYSITHVDDINDIRVLPYPETPDECLEFDINMGVLGITASDIASITNIPKEAIINYMDGILPTSKESLQKLRYLFCLMSKQLINENMEYIEENTSVDWDDVKSLYKECQL